MGTEKVMSGCGTWIDWQYLFDAAKLLAKCRYTLQYTYPYAYYIEPCPRKELFEYQQAQLEAEIENLSWKIEHAETTDRGDLENQRTLQRREGQNFSKISCSRARHLENFISTQGGWESLLVSRNLENNILVTSILNYMDSEKFV